MEVISRACVMFFRNTVLLIYEICKLFVMCYVVLF